MSELKKRIERIKYLLSEADNQMLKVTNENFYSTLTRVKQLLKESRENKFYLLSKYDVSELKTFEPELTNLTKQVAETFDNIGKKKKLELTALAERIKSVQNQKKLVNYHR